jgi:spore maturation protein CgeB
MTSPLNIAFFGSSLVSAYWNGAATYYRGMVRALAARGHRVTFYEPDAYGRQAHRDMADPPLARIRVYQATEAAAAECLEEAAAADLVVKAGVVGVLDDFLEREVLALARPGVQTVFWDVDAPATLARLQSNPNDPLRALLPGYDLVLTYGGGPPVVEAYLALGARTCVPVYNGLDPDTHYPAEPRAQFAADLSFLGNRLPDREARVREFLFGAAERLPGRSFLLGGSGWDADLPALPNLRVHGHVYTRDHNAFNRSALAVLNVCRESMAVNGWSPATRVFEAAGAGACIISDAWEGIGEFLEPGREVLVAEDGAEVAEILTHLTPDRARAIGESARRRALAEHTYQQRAALVESILAGTAQVPGPLPASAAAPGPALGRTGS